VPGSSASVSDAADGARRAVFTTLDAEGVVEVVTAGVVNDASKLHDTQSVAEATRIIIRFIPHIFKG
jgi:hypothetical protein